MLLDIWRQKLPLMWRVHYMSKLMSRPVYPKITLKFGISEVEFRVIITIWHVPGLTANQIIEVWALDKMSVSRAVRSLLGRKLLRRAVDRSDSRRRPLYLTADGTQLYGKIWPGAEMHYRDLANVLTQKEMQVFITATDKLIERAAEAWEEVAEAP